MQSSIRRFVTSDIGMLSWLACGGALLHILLICSVRPAIAFARWAFHFYHVALFFRFPPVD